MRKLILPVVTAICCLTFCTQSRGDAVTYTFDTSAELFTNFDIDVIGGDGFSQWRPGYIAGPAIEASDGGFVHFNNWDRANSLRFLSGPVFLNSFDLSSNFSQSTGGTNQANSVGNDYRLVLYDTSFNVLYDQTLLVSPTGSWDEVTLNVDNVSTIWLNTHNVNGPQGWWPNVDNIRVNQIPEPGSLAVVSLVGLVAATRRRK
ncbi:MAG: PEP-CTERM sorting domain-containing protein [Planctomycetota bacterium]